MKSITVRRNRNHRLCIRMIAAMVLVGVFVLLVGFRQDLVIAALLCLPLVLILLPLWLYFETWRISFNKDGICKKVLWLDTGRYSYLEMKDVVLAWSYTDYGYIRITFTNGRHMKFRLEDENADIAKKRIRSHHSIRTKG